ncbi:RNA 2'-phosphotransferase [Phaeacidiphilus oryzae]|uniref:RNA 2'-phosphotransferase n=1 Tax=Phaeacidiphilus oryzae TaxID=348818 RepID=UPI00055DBCEA|nr:RNA 2'-phosphotransferase [Phaeacidiphilus oryzae]
MPRRAPSSRFLALVLRHRPELVGIQLDSAGWVAVDRLLAALAEDGRPLSRAELDEIVATNDKRRFEVEGTGATARIRASQGHSVAVELGYAPAVPPDLLFHGTHGGAVDAILREGLRPMTRHAVHLSAEAGSAARVGARRGRPVVLRVDAARMARDGYRFEVSANGVWLVEAVPPAYLAPEG